MPHTIIQNTYFDEKKKSKARALVAIAGEYGAGAEEVGKLLADALGVQFFDPPLLQHIVQEAEENQALHDRLDLLLPSKMDKWIDKLLSKGRKKGTVSYLHLVKAIMGIVPRGGVIVGMGAHLILSGQRVFRLKIEAGPAYCADNIARKAGVDLAAAKKLCNKVDRERVKFVKEIYERFPTDDTYYDLVLSAESFSPERMSKMALKAMCLSGYEISTKICDESKG
uniref:Cytidylate kinase-like family protein n=1 Tax=Magnetococcus massalia (strain MO-1) TaxID=451514 RepID=A0A1S7LFD1_MAGMO|nr:conserved protein of unknown function [Candidatus Magnetococcus massalia]